MAHVRFGTRAQLDIVTAPILAAADGVAHVARKIKRARPRPLRGATLRPGPATPLWNKLAATAAKLICRRGDKAQLARILGISRQRLHLLLTAKSACPDAERTLLLIEWVAARKNGQNLA